VPGSHPPEFRRRAVELAREGTKRRAATIELGVAVDEFVLVGEPVTVHAEADDSALVLEAHLRPAGTRQVPTRQRLISHGDGLYTTPFRDLPTGGYEIVVGRHHPSGRLTDQVHTLTVVADPAKLAMRSAPPSRTRSS
jgi:hypothetical protein